MTRATYLADTSVFARLSKPVVAAALARLIARGRVALCGLVVFELGFSARNLDDHRAIMIRLTAFESIPVLDGDHRRAIEVQQLLAHREKGWRRCVTGG